MAGEANAGCVCRRTCSRFSFNAHMQWSIAMRTPLGFEAAAQVQAP